MTERAKVGNNNGQLRIATPPQVAHAKPPGPIIWHPLVRQHNNWINFLLTITTKPISTKCPVRLFPAENW